MLNLANNICWSKESEPVSSGCVMAFRFRSEEVMSLQSIVI